jgi:hypothetical protein
MAADFIEKLSSLSLIARSTTSNTCKGKKWKELNFVKKAVPPMALDSPIFEDKVTLVPQS